MPLNKLVKEPLTLFSKLTGNDGAFNVHEKNRYHKHAVLDAVDFLKVSDNHELSVINRICSERLKQVEENRKRLKII